MGFFDKFHCSQNVTTEEYEAPNSGEDDNHPDWVVNENQSGEHSARGNLDTDGGVEAVAVN